MRFIKPMKGGGGVDTSDATAISDNILMDRTAYARGEKLVGTMGLHEDASETTIQPGESFQIIDGYHTGGVVKAPDLTDLGNATAADVASGKTFTSEAGLKVEGTGSMAKTTATARLNYSNTGIDDVYVSYFDGTTIKLFLKVGGDDVAGSITITLGG